MKLSDIPYWRVTSVSLGMTSIQLRVHFILTVSTSLCQTDDMVYITLNASSKEPTVAMYKENQSPDFSKQLDAIYET